MKGHAVRDVEPAGDEDDVVRPAVLVAVEDRVDTPDCCPEAPQPVPTKSVPLGLSVIERAPSTFAA